MAEQLRVDSLGHITPEFPVRTLGYNSASTLAAGGIILAIFIAAQSGELGEDESKPAPPVPTTINGGLKNYPKEFDESLIFLQLPVAPDAIP